MVAAKIPDLDPRVTSEYAEVNGNRIHYLYGMPEGGNYSGTVFLIHGWPDLAYGWRNQFPLFLSLGFRVVAPDCIGYGGTDAPRVPPASMHVYGFKRASDNIAGLAKLLGASEIILGGHDWGGMVVHRAALYHPQLIKHLFSVCTPYGAPQKSYFDLDRTVELLPMFGYQKQLAGPDVEARVQNKKHLRSFFNAMFGGRTEKGEMGFDPLTGVKLDIMDQLSKTPLLTDEQLEYYIDQYSRNGMHGPLNWYRKRRADYEDELSIENPNIEIPVLFIQANRDNVLRPELSLNMEKYMPNLTRREVDASHWILWQKPDEVNAHLKEWIDNVVSGNRSKL